MLRHLVPKSIRTPFARYSHAVEVPPDARWLLCSGQLGISPDDTIPGGTEEQAVLCFEAIGACLKEAGMSFGDIVRINAYVTAREHMAPYMAVRDRYVALPPPASTLMIVSGFTRPEFNVEIEAIAAKAIGKIGAP
ncbi:MAG TPA: RidA family protein [Candidatus Binatia bacterium]|jgi:enamine deaminase RidA (YjgF/YER057c/UK114 family)|nr:RidA family protein [Candidatus Binatia bacterium]